MTIALSTAARNARLNALRDTIDAGVGAGLLRIYNGTRPASGGTATTKLAELTLTDPSAPNASSGVLTLSSITDDSAADASGTATWFRIVDSAGNFVVDGDISDPAGSAELKLVNTNIAINQPVQVSSFTFTEANA